MWTRQRSNLFLMWKIRHFKPYCHARHSRDSTSLVSHTVIGQLDRRAHIQNLKIGHLQ